MKHADKTITILPKFPKNPMHPRSPASRFQNTFQTPLRVNRRRRLRSGMTLVEVMVALMVFTLASIGFATGYNSLNARATRLRCDAVTAAILRAKVAKVLTDQWISQSTPLDCVLTNGWQTCTADPNDPYDVGPTVTLLSSSDLPQTGFITGTIYRNTYSFDASAKTVVVDYKVTYTYRNKTYTVYASTIRAQDN
jgi:prepilin-type N-terminal cleavage/methylation domain-containing protein